MTSVGHFHWFDYLIFGATLLISIVIGLYYALHAGGQKTTKEFLLGGRKMPVVPTALSLLVSFQSGILLLGISSEMYVKGTTYFWYIFGTLVGIPLAAWVYQPIFYRLKLTSAYEYLEIRFRSKLMRLIGSFLFISVTVIYMAIVLYAPAIALNQVSGIRLEILIVVSGLACTFYTTLGGLKAVVWTDAFQAVVMYGGLIAVIVQGTINVGGARNVWIKAWDGGRIITKYTAEFSFDPNPFTYMNFWVVVVGTALGWMSIYGTNQTAVQRYTSLSSLRKAQLSLLLVVPGIFTMCPLVMIAGLVMYAYYADCDPLHLGLVSNRDQLLPYFTVDILGHIPGLPGVFLACLYSGTLSTVSSGLNSLAAVIWEDCLKDTPCCRYLTEAQATKINKITACSFGFLSIALACVAQFLGGVFQATLTVLSMLAGPLAGLFLFGMIFPWANMPGALLGVIGSSAIMAWICIGAQLIKPYRTNLPSSIAGCTNATLQLASSLMTESFVAAHTNNTIGYSNQPRTLTLNFTGGSQDLDDFELTGYQYIYKLSYKMYGLAAIMLVFLIGVPVSLCTSKCTLDDRDANLVWPKLRYVYSCCLSPRWKSMLQYCERDAKDIEHETSVKVQMPNKRSRENYGVVKKMLETNAEYNSMKEQAFMDTLRPCLDNNRHGQPFQDDENCYGYYTKQTQRLGESFENV